VSSRFVGSVRELEDDGVGAAGRGGGFLGWCCRGSALPCGPGCGGGTAQNQGGIEPGEEVRDGPVIGHAGVLDADGGGEEFEEAADSGVAGAGDRRRHGEAAAPGRFPAPLGNEKGPTKTAGPKSGFQLRRAAFRSDGEVQPNLASYSYCLIHLVPFDHSIE
jgi:hypothetical protein